MEQQILRDVRAQIRDEQAAQFAPLLFNKTWKPAEEHLSSLPLNQAKLEQLRDVWSDGNPPQPKESVLEDTWELWQEAAKEALEVTQAGSLAS